MTIHISIVRMCCKRCAMLHGSPKSAKFPCLAQCDQIASYISPETIRNRLHAVENIIRSKTPGGGAPNPSQRVRKPLKRGSYDFRPTQECASF